VKKNQENLTAKIFLLFSKFYLQFVFFDELNGIVFHVDNDPWIQIAGIIKHVVSNTEDFPKFKTKKRKFFFKHTSIPLAQNP
jgi:hypothetical protein